MKTVTIPSQATDVLLLLNQARDEDILVQASDGTEFMLSAVNDFQYEIARTRQNAKLMAMLDERARGDQTVSLDEVKQQLGLQG